MSDGYCECGCGEKTPLATRPGAVLVTLACRHTPCPTSYVHWHHWAERKARTHRQEQCPACGLWAIWKRTVSRA